MSAQNPKNSHAKVQVGNGLKLPVHQAVSHVNTKHETQIYPSSSQPSFSNYFVIDIRAHNNDIEQLSLLFSLSALNGAAGLTYNGEGDSNNDNAPFPEEAPYYVPGWFLFSRIELCLSNTIINTIYGGEQFILNQLFNNDKQRLTINNK